MSTVDDRAKKQVSDVKAFCQLGSKEIYILFYHISSMQQKGCHVAYIYFFKSNIRIVTQYKILIYFSKFDV